MKRSGGGGGGGELTDIYRQIDEPNGFAFNIIIIRIAGVSFRSFVGLTTSIRKMRRACTESVRVSIYMETTDSGIRTKRCGSW